MKFAKLSFAVVFGLVLISSAVGAEDRSGVRSDGRQAAVKPGGENGDGSAAATGGGGGAFRLPSVVTGGQAIDGGVDGDGDKSTADRGSWLPSSLRKVLLPHLYDADGEHLHGEEGEAFGRDGGDGGGSSNGTADEDVGEVESKVDGDLMEDGGDDVGFGDVDDGDGQKVVDSSPLGSPAPTAVVALPPGSTRRGPSDGTPQLKPTSAVAAVPNLRGKAAGSAPNAPLYPDFMPQHGRRLAECLASSADCISCQVGMDVNGESAGDQSGTSVAMSADGTVMVIGAWGSNERTGNARIFKLEEGNWIQMGSTLVGVATGDEFGTSVAVSSDGEVIVIGGPSNDVGGNAAGHAQVFDFDADSLDWVQRGPDFIGGTHDYLGRSVALSSSGLEVAIGLGLHDNNVFGFADCGAIRVYRWNVGTYEWDQVGTDMLGNRAGGRLGYSVSMSADGTVVAAGAPYYDGGTGYARVYGWSEAIGDWEQLGSDLLAPLDQAFFGWSVSLSSIDGTVLAIGSTSVDNHRGLVEVFQYDSLSWGYGSPFYGDSTEDAFGKSVALSGDGSKLLVGADGGGYARLYGLDNGLEWAPLGISIHDEVAGDNTGKSVAMSQDGSRIAIGSFTNDGNGADSGHVRVFDIHGGTTCDVDTCPNDPFKTSPGLCGCGEEDPDSGTLLDCSWVPPSTDGGNDSGIFVSEMKSFDGNGADGTGRYSIDWQGFTGNEARTACTWFKLADEYSGEDFNLFEVGSYDQVGSSDSDFYRRFAHGIWPEYNGVDSGFVTHTWGEWFYTSAVTVDTNNWHHACVTWDGAVSPTVDSMKAYYDGEFLDEYLYNPNGSQSLPFNPLNTGNSFNYWGSFDDRFHFLGQQMDLVFIKGRALDASQISDIKGKTGPYSVCGDSRKTGNEDCDGLDFGGKSCQSEGYDIGELGCSDQCSFDLSNCNYDADSDDIPDTSDNCPLTPNSNQDDFNSNGVGDACDDSDGDGVFDAVDNCIDVYNPDQSDADGDGMGDACDDTFDGEDVIEAFWEGTLELSGLVTDENTDYILLADQLADTILTILPGIHENGSVVVSITSIDDIVLSHNRRSLQEPDISAVGYEVEYTLPCPEEPTCSSMESTAHTDIDAITSALDLTSGTPLGDYTVQSNNFGEPSTVIVTPDLAHRQDNAATAKAALETYTETKSAYKIAEHNLAIITTKCEDATAAAEVSDALADKRLGASTQADKYAAEMQSIYDNALALANNEIPGAIPTAADKTWKLLNAKADLDVALAEKAETSESSNEATADAASANTYMTSTCTTGVSEATATRDAALLAFNDARSAVNNNLNIPAINPTTLDFVYVDTDGDLIPNEFDACPTKMGLRKDSPEIPGPQDFCPSGCPELWDTVNNKDVDSDGDGIPDCEDRCPFQHGIAYNHNWFEGADLSSLPRDLDYNGCPDKDEDGIPDLFDACPDQKGGSCYSGCPDRGVDPSTGSAFDADLDGISDCADRCPNTYGVGLTNGCPDLDMDGVPDHRDYCMATPGSAEFSYERKLQDGQPMKYLNIMGCPDADGDLVPDPADLCDAPTYPNQGPTTGNLGAYVNIHVDGVAIVDNAGCPLDSDDDGVYDGVDMCDDTVHSQFPKHDPKAIVFSPEDDGHSDLTDDVKLGCPKDTDNDGVVDGIDQCPNEGGRIHRDGCPIDTDRDGVKDCVSVQASPDAYVWPLSPTACHSTGPDSVEDSCCTIARDFCPLDTPRGATVYADQDAYVLFHPDLFGASGSISPTPLPGCSYDSDADGVDDGVDICPGTTPFEIDLANNRPEKVTIDDNGCPFLTPFMWDATFIDVTTTESNGANPSVELLFTVNADLFNILEARQYITTNDINTNEMLEVRVMDSTCQNTFDDVTDTGDKLLPISVAMDSTGNFKGQTPFDSYPFTFTLDLNPDGIVGSPIWTIDQPYDVGSIDFCLSVAILSDTQESVTMTELKTTILIDMTQDFSVIDTKVERAEADETTKLIDVDYPIEACQCTDDDPTAGADTCVYNTDLDDSFLAQGDALRLCIRFDEDENGALPPAYVQMVDVKTFTCSQGGLTTIPIQDFVRDDDGGQVVYVETVTSEGNGEPTSDDRMTKIDYVVPPAFFGPEERPLDCTGTIVLAFTEGENIARRVLAEVPISFNHRGVAAYNADTVERRMDVEAEAQTDFAVEAMLAKADSGRLLAALAAGLAVAGVAATVGAVVMASKTLPMLRLSKLPSIGKAGAGTQAGAGAESGAETDLSTEWSSDKGTESFSSSEYEYARSVHASYGGDPQSSISRAYAA